VTRLVWLNSFTAAYCQRCEWKARRYDGTEPDEAAKVLAAARRHSRKHGHYVQVERGQIASYGDATQGVA